MTNVNEPNGTWVPVDDLEPDVDAFDYEHRYVGGGLEFFIPEKQPDLEGEELLQAFVDRYVGGAQGCSMDWEAAQDLAKEIEKILTAKNSFTATPAYDDKVGDIPSPTMDILSPVGSKIRFIGKNGYECERERAKELLEIGGIYEVLDIEVSGCMSSVAIAEGSFNTVMFENVTE